MSPSPFEVLQDGLLFPEAPRWHDERLWFSEKRAGRVIGLHADGTTDFAIAIDGEPGGIGWRPDGSMLVVSMQHRAILRVAPDRSVSRAADLSTLTRYRCNDMVVDGSGNAFVGDFGYDMAAGDEPAPGVLILVPSSGSEPRVVADDMHFPNGAVVTPDGATLVVAESAMNRLTAFTVSADGNLTNRRIWAALGDVVPDGICLDAEGAIWVADPIGDQVVRVAEGGKLLDRRATTQGAFACELGGEDGTTLFVCIYDAAQSISQTPAPVGSILATPVEVPAAT